ncbi:MAG: phosphatase PAP2 family protein [Mogibacterium sp.]|nr:phosphatase PAP2 family protein [Mogibacterium sp.]
MDSITQLDGNLLIGIQHALNADWLTPIMKGITLLGEDGIFWIALCLLMILFRKTRRLGIICASSLLLTFISCNLILKPLVDRVRPWVTFQMVNAILPPPGDASFPSGHSANSMGPAWGMFLATMPLRTASGRSYDDVKCLGWKGEGFSPQLMHKCSIAAVVLAVLIGISRLYLGMHYPTDVICGLLLGMIAATVAYKIILMIEEKRGTIGS